MARKRKVDQEAYFTSPELAAECVRYVKGLVDWDRFDGYLEPSAGAGAFVGFLPEGKRVCLDVEPRSEWVEREDFFRWEPGEGMGRMLAIGNPPFGQRGALAVKFLERACRYCEAVAFILPRSFRKYTFVNRVDPRFHLLGEFDCEDFVTPEGKCCRVKSVFQVWERREVLREKIVLRREHGDFLLKHCHVSRTSTEVLDGLREEYDFAIPQVGGNFRPRDPEEVRAGSYWFVKEQREGVREVFERLDFSYLAGTNTVFMSLSRGDIVEEYVRRRAEVVVGG